MSHDPSQRSIRIEGSASGSAIVSGSGNTIYVIQQTIEQFREAGTKRISETIGLNPYKGLAAFKESDAALYFGRENQVQQLMHSFQNLQEQTKMPRFLPIIGSLGCGKSSLARAGFIPELARRPPPGRQQMRVAVLVPGTRPLQALASILAKVATDNPRPIEKTEEFNRELSMANEAGEYDGLQRISALLPAIREIPLVLLIDQLEEVYILAKGIERECFIANLLYAAQDQSQYVSVIVTLRADFVASILEFPELSQSIQSQSLFMPPLTSDELAIAITEPAKQAGYEFGPETVELLVERASKEPQNLGALQVALSKVWEGLEEEIEPIVTLREIGYLELAIRKQSQRSQCFTEPAIQLDLMLIPGGTFTMGSPEDELGRYDDEGPQHDVTVPTFLMGRYPVTQAQWREIANRTDLKVRNDLDSETSNFKGDDRPVEQVSWHDAVEFCARLSKATGHTYRLPTEAEWEYACRAGTDTPFHFGESITTDLANYCGEDDEDEPKEYPGNYGNGPKGIYRQETTTVNHFHPIANAFGLCDMHGNVWEWCLDHWHSNYDSAPTDGSAWLTNDDGARRVLRGGSWDNVPRNCRSAYRVTYYPDDRLNFIGFRVVCEAQDS